MLLMIILALLVCVITGFAVLPVLVIGALAISALSFYVTRNPRIRLMGTGFALYTAMYLTASILNSQAGSEIPSWATWAHSDTLLGGLAVVTTIFAAGLGIFGPMLRVPTDMESVMQQVKDADDKLR